MFYPFCWLKLFKNIQTIFNWIESLKLALNCENKVNKKKFSKIWKKSKLKSLKLKNKKSNDYFINKGLIIA